MENFRTERVGIYTIKVDPTIVNLQQGAWIRVTPEPELIDLIKQCDRIEFEIIPMHIEKELENAKFFKTARERDNYEAGSSED